MSWLERYPGLAAKVVWSATQHQNVLILDVGKYQESNEEVRIINFEEKELVLVTAGRLANDLDKMVRKEIEGRTLFVFPGNGGLLAQNLSTVWHGYYCAKAHAKRFWTPGSDPICTVGEIMTHKMILPEIELVVVIDDVISSGKTMTLLQERNNWKFPRAHWFGCAWLIQRPVSKYPSGLKGYKKVITPFILDGPNNRKVPINSLSTLLEYREIAESYCHRHFRDRDKFLALIRSMM